MKIKEVDISDALYYNDYEAIDDIGGGIWFWYDCLIKSCQRKVESQL